MRRYRAAAPATFANRSCPARGDGLHKRQIIHRRLHGPTDATDLSQTGPHNQARSARISRRVSQRRASEYELQRRPGQRGRCPARARRLMERPLLREQTPAEYFKELVESALARQHLQAGDLTEYYLVNLLCQYVRPEPRRRRSTASRWPSGSRGRCRPADRSSAPGCAALAISRSSCRGSSPTASAAATSTSTTTCRWGSTPTGRSAGATRTRSREVFAELARKFVGFMDVLADISERHRADARAATSCGSTRSGCAPAARATGSGSSSGASSRTARSGSGSFSSRCAPRVAVQPCGPR